ncbi:hypothetical protein M9194_07750 [Vibrio sp. S4M6]|uniref:hypothetical protein n=1 Tax=Vibrio sinus TaxID=2946865 RepID=UPI00202A6AB3|nr:hypothetical protein [Vibrio sinus]MCL9781319.1 hypothetical protein [Vibrio sinus]
MSRATYLIVMGLSFLGSLSFPVQAKSFPMVSLQSPTTLTLNAQAEKLNRVSGGNARMLNKNEQALVPSHFIAWAESPTQNVVVDHSNRSSITHSMMSVTSSSARVNFRYGAQQKQANIALLGYLVEVTSNASNKLARLQASSNCIVWQGTSGNHKQLLIKSACSAQNTLVGGTGDWKATIKTLYYGMNVSELKKLKGGVWRVSQPVSFAFKTPSKQISIALSPGNLSIDIPVSSTLEILNHSEVILAAVTDSRSASKDYVSSPNNDVSLKFSTNQSITGVNYQLSCGSTINDKDLSTCAIKNTESGTKNALHILFTPCESEYRCIQTPKTLTRSAPLHIQNTEGTQYSKLHVIAPGLGRQVPGTYTGIITITATTTY